MDRGDGRVAYRCFHQEFLVEKRFKYVPEDPKEAYPKEFGRGAYGIVCGFIDPSTGEGVAVKKITNVFSKSILTKRALREMKLLQHFRGHENITCLYDMDIPRPHAFNEVYLYEERMECDLAAIIHSKQPLTDDHFQSFIHQILAGLKYIHSANVLHRDLKPGNLLVTSDCKLKIADFGLARGFSEDPQKNIGFLTEYVATRWYRAPEIMLGIKGYSKAVDIWSVGCIFAELFNRVAFFKGRDWVNQLELILTALGIPSEDFLGTLEPAPQKYLRNTIPPEEGETHEEYMARLERGRMQVRQDFGTAQRFPGALTSGLSERWARPRPGEMGPDYLERLTEQLYAENDECIRKRQTLNETRASMNNEDFSKYLKTLEKIERELPTIRDSLQKPRLTPSPLALDLMYRMLAFDPDERISVEDALEHPYVEVWHNPEAEPVCSTPFNFDFEVLKGTEEMKRYILDEVMRFRDSVRQYPSQSAGSFDQQPVAQLDYIPDAPGGQWTADEPKPQEIGPMGDMEQNLANGLDYPGMRM